MGEQVEVTPVEEGELDAYRSVIAVGFGRVRPPGDEAPVVELDRVFAARVDGEIVGGAGSYTQDVTPAGPAAPLPMAAVTNVSVQPTHTRMGALTALMGALLDQAGERGEAVATLYASEATIYGRFGFGIGSWSRAVRIDAHRARLHQEPQVGGRVRLVADHDERLAVLPGPWEAYRRGQPGEASRTPAWWEAVLGEEGWIGGGEQFVVVHDPADGGPPDGHCRYKVHAGWGAGGPTFSLRVLEMAAAAPEVEAVLWQHCFGVDLVQAVECWRRPERDPLLWRLADARAAVTTAVGDNLWVRVLDVPAALVGRAYGDQGSLVLEVDDPFRPSAGGRFLLDVGVDGAACQRTDAEPDLALGADALGSLWLGGVSPTLLATSGRIEERHPGALAIAERLFPMAQSPLNQTPF